MQLGTRWTVGTEPPAKLPADVAAAVREVEAELPDHAADWHWTLTWLEGRAQVELDDGTVISG